MLRVHAISVLVVEICDHREICVSLRELQVGAKSVRAYLRNDARQRAQGRLNRLLGLERGFSLDELQQRDVADHRESVDAVVGKL